ncbi:MAG: DegQ family serine endoprotease [Betaproteobacteria bacterium]|nr:DegQ family serine endoprotease [Betaproteobacteria bacterium]
MLKDVTPSVVNIAVLQRSPEMDNPLLRDPFFRRFFNLPERPRPQLSAGSGVIVDAAKGYVLTNHHVIKDAQEIVVILKDNRQTKAKLVGSDAGTDIAVLKIEPENLSALRFGDSDALSVGDFVIAIGNPFGLGQTVTSGIVSALGRSGINIEGYEDFIQTDASINPGNSGGALVNLKGELVGINTAIIGPAGGNVGIGFAVPANMAKAVMAQIIRFGEVRRGRLGLSMQDLTPDLAKSLGANLKEGAVVTEVEPDSPAAKAGLKPGDVVMTVNNRPVRSSGDLRNQLALIPVGESADMRLIRGGKETAVKARIGQVEAQKLAGGEALPELAGATVANFQAGSGREKKEAVMVTEVAAGSPAYFHGLRPGDVIVGVNRKKVRTVKELIAAFKGAERIALNVVRGDFLLVIVVR